MCYGPETVVLVPLDRDHGSPYKLWEEFGVLQDEWSHASMAIRGEKIYSSASKPSAASF